MKKFLVLILFLIALKGALRAQEYNIGAFVGGNLNFVTVKSSYEQLSEKPVFGVAPEIGLYAVRNYNRWGLMELLQYQQKMNRTESIELTDESGSSMGTSSAHIIQHTVVASSLVNVQIGRGLWFGSGISLHVLLGSKLNTNFGYLGEKKFTIDYYRPFSMSVPVAFGYNHKRLDLMMKYNIGLQKKVKESDNASEYDNTLAICVGYRFLK